MKKGKYFVLSEKHNYERNDLNRSGCPIVNIIVEDEKSDDIVIRYVTPAEIAEIHYNIYAAMRGHSNSFEHSVFPIQISDTDVITCTYTQTNNTEKVIDMIYEALCVHKDSNGFYSLIPRASGLTYLHRIVVYTKSDKNKGLDILLSGLVNLVPKCDIAYREYRYGERLVNSIVLSQFLLNSEANDLQYYIKNSCDISNEAAKQYIMYILSNLRDKDREEDYFDF